MPELPEVETVRRGLAPDLLGQRMQGAAVRQTRLRWPVPEDLDARLCQRRIEAVERRGKYLLLRLDHGCLILHLGMSGSLRIQDGAVPPGRHDHVDLRLEDGRVLRLRDPRRFGAVLWSETPAEHPLLASLGIEPLHADFDANWLHAATRGRAAPIKAFIMDAHHIVGVGNIYANESLFLARLHPATAAGRLSLARCTRLVEAIKVTLEAAIRAGGSSLRDFVDGHGNPGYFQQGYQVYGRAGEACPRCGGVILSLRQSGRATYYCPRCQAR
jgi:formamidopyrimidine-DNA glycosylase